MRGLLLPGLLLALTTSCLEDDPPGDPSDPDYCPTVEIVLTPVKLVRQGDICVVPGSGSGGSSVTGGGINCEEFDLTECNGSCADLATSQVNCGACGNRCGPTEFCDQGACTK